MFYWIFLCLLLISYLLNAIESSYELEVQLKNILKQDISEVKAVCWKTSCIVIAFFNDEKGELYIYIYIYRYRYR